MRRRRTEKEKEENVLRSKIFCLFEEKYLRRKIQDVTNKGTTKKINFLGTVLRGCLATL